MFIDTSVKDTRLERPPFKSIAIPRPIGWISTLGTDGTPNLAPYSQFTNVTFAPPHVMISINRDACGELKHTAKNIIETGEFVHNVVPYALLEQMNISASDFPYETDEFEKAGLTKEPMNLVKPFGVKESPIKLECQLVSYQSIDSPTLMGKAEVFIAKVVGMHIDEDIILPDGRIDVKKIKPLARLGYNEYTYVETIFPVEPLLTDDKSHKFGLEGNPNEVV